MTLIKTLLPVCLFPIKILFHQNQKGNPEFDSCNILLYIGVKLAMVWAFILLKEKFCSLEVNEKMFLSIKPSD